MKLCFLAALASVAGFAAGKTPTVGTSPTCVRLIEDSILGTLPISRHGVKSLTIPGPYEEPIHSAFGQHISAFALGNRLWLYSDLSQESHPKKRKILFDSPIRSLSYTPITDVADVKARGVLTLIVGQKLKLLLVDATKIPKGKPILASAERDLEGEIHSAESVVHSTPQDNRQVLTFVMHGGRVTSFTWSPHAHEPLIEKPCPSELSELDFSPEYLTTASYGLWHDSLVAVGGQGKLWLGQWDGGGKLTGSEAYLVDSDIKEAAVLPYATPELQVDFFRAQNLVSEQIKEKEAAYRERFLEYKQDRILMARTSTQWLAFVLGPRTAAGLIWQRPLDYTPTSIRSIRANTFLMTGIQYFDTQAQPKRILEHVELLAPRQVESTHRNSIP